MRKYIITSPEIRANAARAVSEIRGEQNIATDETRSNGPRK